MITQGRLSLLRVFKQKSVDKKKKTLCEVRLPSLFFWIISCSVSLFLFCHFFHFSPLGTTSTRVCSCLLSLTAGLARSGRDGWIDLAGAWHQPGNARRSVANAGTVQMDLTCCCFLFASNVSIFSPRLSPHMCLNTSSAGCRRPLCSYRLRIGH